MHRVKDIIIVGYQIREKHGKRILALKHILCKGKVLQIAYLQPFKKLTDMANLLYYSTNTLLAKIITERYFKGNFRVWCSPTFDGNPPSSNPKDLFLRLHKEVKTRDIHSAKIAQVRLGLIKAILNKKKNGEISEKDAIDALSMIRGADISDFKPLIYLIPNIPEIDVMSAPIKDKTNFLSEEYIINELKLQNFDIIQS